MFHKVAARYDVMNDLMSAGLHRLWKDRLVAMVNPPRRLAFDHLDVAGGTGDVAFRIAKAGGPQTAVTVLDINADMLEVGKARAAKRRLDGQLTFVEANAEDLPVRGPELRRLHGRLRHPQRAAHRRRAEGGVPRAEARRAVPLPRILAGRPQGHGPRLRRLFVQT